MDGQDEVTRKSCEHGQGVATGALLQPVYFGARLSTVGPSIPKRFGDYGRGGIDPQGLFLSYGQKYPEVNENGTIIGN